MEAFAAFLFPYTPILFVGLFIHAIWINQIKKRMKKENEQAEKDREQVSQLVETVDRLKMRLDMLTQPRRD